MFVYSAHQMNLQEEIWQQKSKKKHFTLTVPLSTQMYICALANLMLAYSVVLRWTSSALLQDLVN